MEVLLALGILFLLVWGIAWIVQQALFPTNSGWFNPGRYAKQLDATQAWTGQLILADQQIEMICAPAPLALDHDEHAVFVLPGVHLLEPRAIRRGRNYYGGPTIRVAKGLSFRLGAGTSQSESQDELRNIDQGTLVLTSKRLVFMGALRTNNTSLDDIIGVNCYPDGIRVHRERKDRAETYALGQPTEIVQGSGQGLIVFGPMMVAAIEMAKDHHANPRVTAAAWPYLPPGPGTSPLQCGSAYLGDNPTEQVA